MLDLKAGESSRPGQHDGQAEAVKKKTADCAQAKPAHHSNHIYVIDRLLIYLAFSFLLLTIAAQCRILLS
ncbi:MAG: hypothetical protein PHQ94_08935 [Syntrophomonas sp.]|nr:hypothetical protein [Syntrophomonas sp.]